MTQKQNPRLSLKSRPKLPRSLNKRRNRSQSLPLRTPPSSGSLSGAIPVKLMASSSRPANRKSRSEGSQPSYLSISPSSRHLGMTRPASLFNLVHRPRTKMRVQLGSSTSRDLTRSPSVTRMRSLRRTRATQACLKSIAASGWSRPEIGTSKSSNYSRSLNGSQMYDSLAMQKRSTAL